MQPLTVLILMLCVKLAGSVCNFPSDLTGVWIHSSHGDLNFTTSSQFLMTIDQYQNVPGDCHTQVNDNTYIIVSDPVSITLRQNIVVSANIGICLKMEKIKTNLYKLTHLTSEFELANARIVLVSDPTNIQVLSICNDNTTHAHTEYNLLMKKENKTVVCVYDTLSSGENVLWTYNMDTLTNETTTFRFTCFVYEVNDSAVNATQNPKFCDFTQTSTSVTSTLGKYINGSVSSKEIFYL
ncbi:hypothetical protein KUTeg_024785 [Tegillarca granosa]|uniref:Uncharacterized protein n=1 Tax=Tegillarca granosa TaxID=220873 RepID=A0ABQ9DYW3_TEGGR|nr:hypothetical protein KUTeg_024785 [Tegillarca granosa]